MIRNRILVLLIAIGMLMMTVPPFVMDTPLVQGTVTKLGNGDLIVDGSTHIIDMDGFYQHEGNITVKGANGKLIIRDTYFKILTPGYTRNIIVENSGQLILENSTITVDLETFNFRESLNIEVKTNGVFDMYDSSLECDGWLKGNGGKIYIRDSTLTRNEDLDGFNDTTVEIILSGSSYMQVYDSDIDYLAENKYIDIKGTSEFIAINTYIDIDFDDVDWSRLKVSENAKAYLYGVTTVVPKSYPPDASAIEVASSNARVEIYKWAKLTVVDGAGIPVGGAFVTAKNFTESAPIKVPRTEILNYFGKTTSDWNLSGVGGLVTLPLKVNILRYAMPSPTINYTGTYNLTAKVTSFSEMAKGGISFTSYPRMLGDENVIMKNITFKNTVIPPDKNKHYYNKSSLVITGQTTFKKPIQVKENIIINGGTLTLSSAQLNFAQDAENRFYILVKNGGTLSISDSKIMDNNNYRFNIYSYGGTISTTGTLFDDLGAMVIRSGGNVELRNTQLNGNFNAGTSNAVVKVTDHSFFNSSIVVMDDTNVMIGESVINASMMLSIDDITLTAVNTSFSKALHFNGDSVAELINVNIKNKIEPITVEDNAEVHRGWWLTANVTDGGVNPVVGSEVKVYNYSLPSGDPVLYSTSMTNSNGQTIVKVIGEIITATGTKAGIERSYYLEATYMGLTSSSAGFTSPTKNLKRSVKFTEKPDIRPVTIVIKGSKIEGKTLTFAATIENKGSFEARNILVRFWIGEKQIGTDKIIDYLDKGETTNLEVDWQAGKGKYDLRVTADPLNTISETDETNNNLTTVVDITKGAPDIEIKTGDITFNPERPTIKQMVNINISIRNTGGSDPYDFNNPVMVKIYLGDPDTDGVQIGNTATFYSIEPGGTVYTDVDYTFNFTGSYYIYAEAQTALDADTMDNLGVRELVVTDYADLTIKSAGISFAPGSKVAKNTAVTISANVANIGDSDAKKVAVEFFEGDPAGSSYTLLGKNTVDIIPTKDSVKVILVHTFIKTGNHNIFVVVDRLNSTGELDETNNKANSTLRVLLEPDLVTKQITLHSSLTNHIIQDEMITITAVVVNEGETAAYNFVIQISYKSSQNVIGAELVEVLEPGMNITIQLGWIAPDVGTYNIRVLADANADVLEEVEDNNEGILIFRIYSKPDLTMDPEDIFTEISETPVIVPYSQELTLTAQVRNRGESDADAFWVQFFDGDPSKGATQIGLNQRINGIKAGRLATVEMKWIAVPGGQHNIYVVIDPFNEIIEHNELNNTMSLGIYVKTVPDLKIDDSDLVLVEGKFGRINKQVTIRATITNRGDTGSGEFSINIYDGDPIHDKTFKLLQTFDHDGLGGGESFVLDIKWTPTTFGTHKIFVWADEENDIFEISDDNNYAVQSYKVLELAPDLTITKSDIKITLDDLTPESYRRNTEYEFTVTVHNEGNENISAFSIFISFETPTGATGYLGEQHNEISGVKVSDSATFQTKWKPTQLGDYKFTIIVDSKGEHSEFNETDNMVETTVNVKDKANIYIATPAKDITYSPEEPGTGDVVKIKVKVKIDGIPDEKNLDMDLKVDGTVVSTKTSPIDIKNGTAEFEFQWTADRQYPKLTFVIDPQDKILETKEDDNEVERTNLQVGGATVTEKEDEGSNIWLFLIIIIIVVVVLVIVLFIVMKKRKKQPLECQECGAEVPAGETNCPECGAVVEIPPEAVKCSKCGAEITTADQVCPECGQPNEEFVAPEPGTGGMPGGIPASAPAAQAAQAPAPAQAKPKKSKKKKPGAAAGPAPAPAPAPMPAPMPAPSLGGSETEMAELEGIEDMLSEDGEGEAECYKCGARVPLSVPKCPVCGADFE